DLSLTKGVCSRTRLLQRMCSWEVSRRLTTNPSARGFRSPYHSPQAMCCVRKLVGVAGFEPATPSSRTRCSTRLSHTPTDKPAYTIVTLARQAGQLRDLAPARCRSSHDPEKLALGR